MKTRLTQSFVAAFLIVRLMQGLPLLGADTLHSIEKFNTMKSEWSDLVGNRLRLEGRYALIGKNLLRFKNCELSFRSPHDFPKLVGKSRTIEVLGHLAKQDGRLYFAVETLWERPSDLETFRHKRTRLDPTSAHAWYELAEWARNRSRFYEDPKLNQQADSAYLAGIDLERRQARTDSPDAFFQLAEKVAQWHLPESLTFELVHEGLQLAWTRARKQDARTAELRELADQVAHKLPGATDRLPKPQPQLLKEYLEDPMKVFHSSDSTTRKTLHRLFYGQIVLAAIRQTATDDGHNGLETARQIDEQLPEYHELAEAYRERGFAYRIANILTASRDEMSELADILVQREQPERAKAVIQQWLQARQKTLGQVDPDALCLLAKDYETLLNDKTTAVRLLTKAYKLSDGAVQVANELTRLGYVRSKDRWITPQEFAASPEGQAERAVREGRVVVGMTGQQVQQSLAGPPSFVARMAAEGKFAEVWVYESTGLAIHLVRSISRPDLKVVGITQVQNP